MTNSWEKAQQFEKNWHGSCINTYGEETKQLLYADRMGLKTFHNGKSPYNFDMGGKSVLDIGGGPVSLLLKCENVKGVVIDPMPMPKWVKERYEEAGIKLYQQKGEQSFQTKFDEIWIYNCLQHTENPQKVIENARKVGKLIRIFEWIDTPSSEGHLHTLTEKGLNEWLGDEGKVEIINTTNCKGKAYYGIFPTTKK